MALDIEKIKAQFSSWFDKKTTTDEMIFADDYPWEQEDTGNQMNLAAQAYYAGYKAALEAYDPDIKKIELDSAMSWLEDDAVQPSYKTMRKLCLRLVKSMFAIKQECAERLYQAFFRDTGPYGYDMAKSDPDALMEYEHLKDAIMSAGKE